MSIIFPCKFSTAIVRALYYKKKKKKKKSTRISFFFQRHVSNHLVNVFSKFWYFLVGLLFQISSINLLTLHQNMRQNTGTPKICRNKKQSGWAKWVHFYLYIGFKNQFIAKAFVLLKS